ncbi:hypothetical protein AX16_007053 [Volvariella volvacea WC 439]|nr:hypothetical protein AX16_007053 [Volvariella volvacea WC 439]
MFQKALGGGIEENIADAYTFIMNNYNLGDQIFIFRFSRGAFTAGVLANTVARLGIFSARNAWPVKEALKIRRSEEMRGSECDIAKAAFCSEGVPSGDWSFGLLGYSRELGFPLSAVTKAGGVSGSYEHFDNSLVKGIKHAFHALALDECRGPFTPTLWHLPDDAGVAKSIELQRAGSLVFIPTKKRETEGFDKVYQGGGRGRWYDSYKEGGTWRWKYRAPGAYPGKEGFNGPTNETIHASVRERWQSSRKEGLAKGPKVWAPKSLEGFEPREVDGAWVWVKMEQGGWWGKDKGKEVMRINEATSPARCAPSVDLKPYDERFSFERLLRYEDDTPLPA